MLGTKHFTSHWELEKKTCNILKSLNVYSTRRSRLILCVSNCSCIILMKTNVSLSCSQASSCRRRWQRLVPHYMQSGGCNTSEYSRNIQKTLEMQTKETRSSLSYGQLFLFLFSETAAYSVAPERIWKWGHRFGAKVGAPIRRKVPNKILVVPLQFFGYKSTISRFCEYFRDGQYSLVSFFFAVLLLTVPPCPAICKSGGTCPVPYGVGATAGTQVTPVFVKR